MGRRFAASGRHLTDPLMQCCTSGLNCSCARVGSIFLEKLNDLRVEMPLRIPLDDRQWLGKHRRLFQSHAGVRASKTSTTTNILPIWGSRFADAKSSIALSCYPETSDLEEWSDSIQPESLLPPAYRYSLGSGEIQCAW